MRFDLHVHSTYSGDSINKVEEVLDICTRKGLAGVAIIDHNSLEGFRHALSLGRHDVLIIPGMEVSSAEGHVLAYNIQEVIPRGLGVAETIDRIRAQGGMAVAAHPYRMWSGLGEEATLANDFDAIEVHNGRSTHAHNDRAADLAVRMERPFTAGSDSHEPSTVGKAYFETSGECSTVEEVLKEILSLKGRTGGTHRPRGDTLSYGVKCIGEWFGRGFKKM